MQIRPGSYISFLALHCYYPPIQCSVDAGHKQAMPWCWCDNSVFCFASACACDFVLGLHDAKALDRKSFPCSDAITYIFSRPLLFCGDGSNSQDNGVWPSTIAVKDFEKDKDMDNTSGGADNRQVPTHC